MYYDAEMTKQIRQSIDIKQLDNCDSLDDYAKSLEDLFRTKGEKEKEITKLYEIYYDFIPGTNNPILLF